MISNNMLEMESDGLLATPPENPATRSAFSCPGLASPASASWASWVNPSPAGTASPSAQGNRSGCFQKLRTVEFVFAEDLPVAQVHSADKTEPIQNKPALFLPFLPQKRRPSH